MGLVHENLTLVIDLQSFQDELCGHHIFMDSDKFSSSYSAKRVLFLLVVHIFSLNKVVGQP